MAMRTLDTNTSRLFLECFDFYRQTASDKQDLKYLVFDSKFTNYESLSTQDEERVRFLTIRAGGGKIMEGIKNIYGTKRKRKRVGKWIKE